MASTNSAMVAPSGPDNADSRAWSFLIGLAAADGNPQPGFAFLDVLAVEGDKLGAAQGAGKPNQEQRAVTNALQALASAESHRYHMVGGGRRLPSCARAQP